MHVYRKVTFIVGKIRRTGIVVVYIATLCRKENPWNFFSFQTLKKKQFVSRIRFISSYALVPRVLLVSYKFWCATVRFACFMKLAARTLRYRIDITSLFCCCCHSSQQLLKTIVVCENTSTDACPKSGALRTCTRTTGVQCGGARVAILVYSVWFIFHVICVRIKFDRRRCRSALYHLLNLTSTYMYNCIYVCILYIAPLCNELTEISHEFKIYICHSKHSLELC